jgi:hypothetical protein
MNDHASPEVQAVRTVGGVLTDLVEVAEQLPVPPEQAEATARILDRLAEEITEAAGMLRGVTAPPVGIKGSGQSIKGSVPAKSALAENADDLRVELARDLMAEEHEPLTMTPGDLGHLLARHRQAMTLVLAVIDEGSAS